MRLALLALLAMAPQSYAQMPMDFPPGSAPVTAELFQDKVAGGSFRGVRSDGVDWRWDFAKDGGLVVYSRGNSDRGKWRIEGDKLCTDMSRSSSSCNDVRMQDGVLFYKRVFNGEVVTLKGQ